MWESKATQSRPFSDLVERICRQWEAKQRAAAARADLPARSAPAFSVAIARQTGTLGSTVAEEVGRLLGWQVYDHALLEHIAREMGLRTALLESVDERQQSWLLETVEQFAQAAHESTWGPYVSEEQYVHHLVQTVTALGIHGESVIVGRGAVFILPRSTTLRVRLVAPLQDRIAAVIRTQSFSSADAASYVRTRDRERDDFVADHFLKNPQEPSNFDLVVNTARLPPAKNAELIVLHLRRLQANAAESAVR